MAGKKNTRLWLVFGEDSFQVNHRSKEIISELLPDEQSRLVSLETVESTAENTDAAVAALSQCVAALLTTGLFSERKVVWLKDAWYFGGGRTADKETGSDGGAKSKTDSGAASRIDAKINALLKIVQDGLPPETFLLISAPKIDKRKSFYKTLASSGVVEEFAAPERSYQAEGPAREFLLKCLNDKGLSMDRDAVELFLGMVGFESARIAGEVEKIAVYVHPLKKATRSDVEAVASYSRETERWDLGEAVANGDLSKAISIFRKLTEQKENAVGLVITLESRFRELTILRHSIDAGWLVREGRVVAWRKADGQDEFMNAMPIKRDLRSRHPFVMKLMYDQAIKYSKKALVIWMRELAALHERLVSTRVAPEIEMEMFLCRMMSK